VLKSLQARLIAAAIFVLLLCGLLAALGSYRAAIIEADEILDAQLAQLAQTLLFLSRVNGGRTSGDIGTAVHSDHSYTIFHIWQLKEPRPGGEGVYLSYPADARPYPRLILRSGDMDSRRSFDRKDGYSHAEFAGRAFRIFARTSADGVYRVIAGQDLRDRQEMVEGIARSNIQPYLLVLPLGILALVGLIYHSLGPIRRLTMEVSSREPTHLAPLAISHVPEELDPLIRALNTLLERLQHAMEYERRFTGDAAHELRTPIAALRAQLDAMRLARDKETRILAHQQASATTDRLARLVNQLLTLSRLDAEGKPSGQTSDLAELARELCQDMGPAAIHKDIDLSLHALTARLRGDEDALRILIRNLLDNALRYTPRGGRVEVGVGTMDSLVRMVVADSGPGVLPERRAALGQRFNRLDQPDGTGVGLGLSIVLRIADQYHGRVVFGTGLDGLGLAVTVELPGVGEAG
jgi:two-component system, OmpR family, sensor histidine kinase QseC